MPDPPARWRRALDPVHGQGTPVGGPKAVHIVGTVQDITDRKRRRSDLREFAAELSEADRRKDEFLATLAHELRNPLAPIRNGLQSCDGSDPTAALEQAPR